MTVPIGRKSEATKALEFHKHFGSSPLDIAEIWYDMCHSESDDPKILLSEKEKSDKGFNRFLAAVYWLWTYPKNASLLASRFAISVDYACGKEFWKWVRRIEALKTKKIVWDDSLDDPNLEVFAISADGVDFLMWERKHAIFPIDRSACSHKFKHCAAKYIIALSVYRSKCVFIAGPFEGGKHDLDIMRESGLMAKLLQNGKVAILDRGYRSSQVEERKHHSYPDAMDSKELNNFKSRARLRQETFNRRLKHFEVLSNVFRHGFAKHEHVMVAVAVMVQYQMDNGSQIYCV